MIKIVQQQCWDQLGHIGLHTLTNQLNTVLLNKLNEESNKLKYQHSVDSLVCLYVWVLLHVFWYATTVCIWSRPDGFCTWMPTFCQHMISSLGSCWLVVCPTQIHELLQHYEESKPAPVLDSSEALVTEVRLDITNYLLQEAQVGGNTVQTKMAWFEVNKDPKFNNNIHSRCLSDHILPFIIIENLWLCCTMVFFLTKIKVLKIYKLKLLIGIFFFFNVDLHQKESNLYSHWKRQEHCYLSNSMSKCQLYYELYYTKKLCFIISQCDIQVLKCTDDPPV